MSEAPFIYEWTGREAAALQAALRMSNERYAEYLGVAVRTVAAWRAKPGMTPAAEAQECLDTAYERLDERRVRRFVHALDLSKTDEQPAAAVVMAAEMALMQARIDQLQEELDRARPGAQEDAR